VAVLAVSSHDTGISQPDKRPPGGARASTWQRRSGCRLLWESARSPADVP
jgi:hypothetical protein